MYRKKTINLNSYVRIFDTCQLHSRISNNDSNGLAFVGGLQKFKIPGIKLTWGSDSRINFNSDNLEDCQY